MENKVNKPEEQNSRPKNNLVRNLIISVMIIICLGLVFWLFSSNAKGEYIGYDQFISYLEKGNVDTVELNANEINIKLKDGSYCWFYNRDSVEESVLYLVEENNKDVSKAHVQIKSGNTTTFSIMSLLYPVLMVVLFVVIFFIFLRQIKGVNNSSMEFVKNRARVYPSKTKFTDVAGADEEKEELKEIIDFLKNPDKFRSLGARVPKGVLLIGPPGTGKTLLAKAAAGEAGVPFFTISGSDFMELYVGVGASRVRDLFANAKKAKPCIIFIDEIDAIGRQRGTGLGGGNDEREQTLNQLLVQMDGFEESENIIVMAATNRADILDPALMRPGRFDRQIYIRVPDVKGREEILKVHSKNKPIASDVDLKQVARVTSGFTGADIENLLNESAILAGRENRSEITMEDINNGIVKVAVGPQKKSLLISDKDKRITAYHEVGHAVVGKLVKNSNPVHEVSIIPRGGAAGYTLQRPENDETHVTKGMLKDQISMLLAGRMAEVLFLEDITTGASNDLQRATELARHMVVDFGMSETVGMINMGSQTEVFIGRDYQTKVNYSEKQAAIIDEEVKKIIDVASQEAKRILSSNKNIVENMVVVLLQKETIYSEEVDMLVDGKSSKEVLDYIENKNKKESIEKQNKSVDDILKLAEERANELIHKKQTQQEPATREDKNEGVEEQKEKDMPKSPTKAKTSDTKKDKTKTKEGTSQTVKKPKSEEDK